jgi:hypothetical protein
MHLVDTDMGGCEAGADALWPGNHNSVGGKCGDFTTANLRAGHNHYHLDGAAAAGQPFCDIRDPTRGRYARRSDL